MSTLAQAGAVSSAPATLEPIRFTLRFPAPHTHYVDVEAVYPAGNRAEIDLMMAVWTPGSYLVREYSRHVEDVTAATPGGESLPIVKTRKNRWRVPTRGASHVTVRYRVYCREMSVRTNWVESRFAILNGAPTFVTLLERAQRPHEVRFVLPDTWKITATALPASPDGAPHHYVAPDYDTLVDSPIAAGNPALYRFDVESKEHLLVNDGEGGVWDGPRAARDTETIVRAMLRMWGFLPYPRYVFLNMITESGGGLEHKDSTLLMTNRWRTSTRKDYVSWLGLVSHEFFHAWNVKRLRPVELGPFDYENETYTENLWVSEGFTDYYGDLMVRRAGLTTDEEYLNELSGLIRSLQTTPGRLVQPASRASFDSWIRQYRPDENSPNVTLSYYTKGGVVAFLLDAKIRQATNGAKTLDDVMRLAYQRYSGARGFTTGEFRRTASEVAGLPLDSWFATHVDEAKDVEYTDAFAWLGLRFKRPNGNGRVDPKGWLGVNTRNDGGRLVVTQVRRETPAYDAGLNVDDEIIALDDYRVRADQWEGRLEKYRPGQKVSVLVARREQVMRLEATLGHEPGDPWRVELDPSATPEQVEHRRAWLEGTAAPTSN